MFVCFFIVYLGNGAELGCDDYFLFKWTFNQIEVFLFDLELSSLNILKVHRKIARKIEVDQNACGDHNFAVRRL